MHIKPGKTFTEVSISLLIILYIYTAVSKLLDFPSFRDQMHNQEIPEWSTGVLIAALPPLEILTALLLAFYATRLIGLWISAMLLAAFTAYIALVVAGFYARTPCSCGGVLKSMGWKTHLVFNILFLLLTCCNIWLTYRERRSTSKN